MLKKHIRTLSIAAVVFVVIGAALASGTLQNLFKKKQ